MKKVHIVVGTRPNFIKVTQFKKHAANYGCEVKIIHTGQHYDHKMADVFFDQFSLTPDFFLDIPKTSQLDQIAEIIKRLEVLFTREKPDLVLVPGDVNSTFAAGFTANRLGIPVGHIESGLRSFDRGMPEEINRILTDVVADLFFITEQSGWDHLIRGGVPEEKMHFVGNTMIDTMVAFEKEIEASTIMKDLGLSTGSFMLMTMHRPSNVDHESRINELIDMIYRLSKRSDLVFPIHPRTRKLLEEALEKEGRQVPDNVHLAEPMGYFDFQQLVKHAQVIITDSGGIQEETTFRQVPCLTLRPNTERPITIDIGTNTLLKFDFDLVEEQLDAIAAGTYKKGQVPQLWDGQSTQRILAAIQQFEG